MCSNVKKVFFFSSTLYPMCPFHHQGTNLNIIRFKNGFNAHRSLYGLTGGDIYVTTFVPKPIKYHILRIPHNFSRNTRNGDAVSTGKC